MDKIAKYRIVGELGRGAMGIVYKGEDPLIGRTVAIKTIRMDAFHKPHQQAEATQRFIREAQSAGNLSHPNIVTIYDVGQSEGITYIAMEYIEGESLDTLIAFRKEFSLDGIIDLVSQIGSALDYAHLKGVVHRDIKPGNILIDSLGKAHIVDFGIARISSSTLTQTGTSLGTPNYMSPEQVAGRKVDHRADIFSLGAILYELLTYEKPFSGESFTTIIYKIMNEDPPPLRTFNARMPEDMDIIIRKALAKKVEERYQSCRELINDLSNYQTLGTTLLADSSLSLGIEKAKKKEKIRRDLKEKWPVEEEKEKAVPLSGLEEKEPGRGKRLLIGLVSLAGIAAVIAIVYFAFLKNGRPVDPNARTAALPPAADTQAQPLPPEKTSPSGTEISALMAEGQRALDDGDYALSIKNMERVLKLNPQESRAQDMLADAKKRLAQQQQEEDLEGSLRLARDAFQRKNFTEAIQLSERALSIDPDSGEAKDVLLQSHLQLGIRFFNAGNYTQSIGKMEEILKLYPGNRTAQDYINRARKKQALESTELNIENTLLLAEQASRNRNYRETIRQAQKVLLLNEKNQRARLLFARAHLELGKQAFESGDFQTSIQHMETVLEFDPQNKEAFDSISNSRAQLKAQEVENLLDQARAAYENEEYEKTRELSQEILEIQPDSHRALEYFNQASIKLAPQEINAVIGEYIQSVKNNRLIEFYINQCTPDFYQTIKAQAEIFVKSFSDWNISVSKVTIQFREISHALVSFEHVLTGVSASEGVTTVLSDGKMEWDLKKMDGLWKITDMKYTHR